MSDFLCEGCVHARRMQPGAYKTINGGLIVNGGQAWMCSNNGVMDLDMTTYEMRCSRFEERSNSDDMVYEYSE